MTYRVSNTNCNTSPDDTTNSKISLRPPASAEPPISDPNVPSPSVPGLGTFHFGGTLVTRSGTLRHRPGGGAPIALNQRA
ncbi:MAG: hypothetical protein QOE09_2934 [Ilumatobacteraceae bacterium]|jgi:hypothetical protein